MNFKPADLFLSIIELFGILVPGAVLFLLYKNFILAPFFPHINGLDNTTGWIAGFIISYILGHFLLGISAEFNRITERILPVSTRAYYESVARKIQLPDGIIRTIDREDKMRGSKIAHNFRYTYYSAFSFIRITNPAALNEIERQAAEYKLFRSLTLLFILDILFSSLADGINIKRVVIDLGLAAFCFYRFNFLFGWTYRLVFEYYLQLKGYDKDPYPEIKKAPSEFIKGAHQLPLLKKKLKS